MKQILLLVAPQNSYDTYTLRLTPKGLINYVGIRPHASIFLDVSEEVRHLILGLLLLHGSSNRVVKSELLSPNEYIWVREVIGES